MPTRDDATRELRAAARALDAAQSHVANLADHEPIPFGAADAIAAALDQIRLAVQQLR